MIFEHFLSNAQVLEYLNPKLYSVDMEIDPFMKFIHLNCTNLHVNYLRKTILHKHLNHQLIHQQLRQSHLRSLKQNEINGKPSCTSSTRLPVTRPTRISSTSFEMLSYQNGKWTWPDTWIAQLAEHFVLEVLRLAKSPQQPLTHCIVRGKLLVLMSPNG